MAQQNPASTDNSQLTNSFSIAKQDLTSSETANNLSPAELYITQRSKIIFDTNDSPVDDSFVSNTTNSIKHIEKMQEWHNKQVNEIYKQTPHRYKYGTPPCKTNHQINSKTKK